MLIILFILSSTVCSVLGQLALKQGMQQIAASGSEAVLKSIVVSKWVFGGLMVYGAGVLFWLMALSRAELTYVYPFASLGYAGIIVGSHFLFKERISRMRLVGVMIIISGVILVGLSAG
jgi:multidrug transporter EmrE-like cation transporter